MTMQLHSAVQLRATRGRRRRRWHKGQYQRFFTKLIAATEICISARSQFRHNSLRPSDPAFTRLAAPATRRFARREAQGCGQSGRLFFGYLVAKQKKVPRLAGRNPPSALTKITARHPTKPHPVAHSLRPRAAGSPSSGCSCRSACLPHRAVPPPRHAWCAPGAWAAPWR